MTGAEIAPRCLSFSRGSRRCPGRRPLLRDITPADRGHRGSGGGRDSAGPAARQREALFDPQGAMPTTVGAATLLLLTVAATLARLATLIVAGAATRPASSAKRLTSLPSDYRCAALLPIAPLSAAAAHRSALCRCCPSLRSLPHVAGCMSGTGAEPLTEPVVRPSSIRSVIARADSLKMTATASGLRSSGLHGYS
jgi:hypothetical protein